jgi:hypothetical protein
MELNVQHGTGLVTIGEAMAGFLTELEGRCKQHEGRSSGEGQSEHQHEHMD